MDGYGYPLDPYRTVGFTSRASYLLDRSSYRDPLVTYSRVPADPYGYGAAGYPVEPYIQPRYAPTAAPVYRSRPRLAQRKRNVPPQNLGPRKKPFKATQKVRFSEEKSFQKNSKGSNKSGSPATALAKETEDLHKLFRTGVDSVKLVEPKKNNGNVASKRKADSQSSKKATKSKQKAGKKQKGKKIKNAKKAKIEKEEPPSLSEEDLKALEAGLEMQRGLCKGVSEFLGIPENKEIETEIKEAGNEAAADVKAEDEKEAEKISKNAEPQRSPEEEKEAESKSFKFFSNLFEEHAELRNLYIEKCNLGSFECLVCRSVDPEKSKTFWNVVSLVMHSKMRKQLRPEHAGYGRAVSAILGWDPEKIPKVPKGVKPAFQAVKATNEVKEEAKVEAEDGKKDEVVANGMDEKEPDKDAEGNDHDGSKVEHPNETKEE
ncbi:hypothetical protein KP509_34G054300 [Ceratopteris richardii]|uniref:Uncharacterized protein n=1 Tax=Ceratopteris richardii TaxID=49495 RepID=A0A8T2QLQ8_CERRI|nr:hypothetical protein KP509_34G054300 [Ceratopteris richardii]KAH7284436.1 hypothetical protein KP509_34G054300 [Ceratopteris richardii]